MGTKIAENISLVIRKNMLMHVLLFSMVFITWCEKYFKEYADSINLSNYSVQENEVFVIVFAKSLNVLQQFRHNIEQDMAAVDVMCSE